MREFSGAVLRPYCAALNTFINNGHSVNDIFEASNKAGSELVKNGKFSDETLKAIRGDVITNGSFIKEINKAVGGKNS